MHLRDFSCEEHPKHKPDFLCLGKSCNYLLLCHECTLQDLDHAKKHRNSLKSCENLWKILQKTHFSKDSTAENLLINRIKAAKNEFESAFEEKLLNFEKKVAETVENLKETLRNKLKSFLLSLNPAENAHLLTVADFLRNLKENTKSLDEQKCVLQKYFAKYEKTQDFLDFNSELLQFLSQKTENLRDTAANYLMKFDSFREAFFSDFAKILDFREFSQDFPATPSPNLLENSENYDSNDTIPTFSRRFPQASFLENSALDVFGKVTLIQTIDCGHRKQEKINEGVIISQVSVLEIAKKLKVVTCSKDKTIRVFDFIENKLENVLRGHSDWVYRFVYFETQRRLVSGSIDKSIRVWEMSEEKCGCLGVFTNESSVISLTKINEESFCFSMRSNGLKLMNLGLEVISHYKFPHDKEIWKVVPFFFRKGELFLFLGVVDGSIAVLFYEKKQKVLTLINLFKECHSSIIFDIIEYRKNEQIFVITSSGDTFIKVWEVQSGLLDFNKLSLVRSWKAHEGFIRKILIYKENLLVSCGDDACLKFWRLGDGKLVQTIKKAHGAAIYWIEKFKDEIIFTAGEDSHSVVKFWQ